MVLMIYCEVVIYIVQYSVWVIFAGTVIQLPISVIPKVALVSRSQPYRVSLTHR